MRNLLRWDVFLVLLAGLLAYSNSFTVPFLSGDELLITDPLTRQYLSPWWKSLVPPPHFQPWLHRPLVGLTLAFNYAFCGLEVWGYHAVNLAIHLANSLLILALLRRLMGPAAALAVSLLWVLHPLQTESVTYISQRAESLMAFCALLTLYGVTRASESPKERWRVLAAAACALGMMAHQTMIVVPVLALLYDWIFLAKFKQESLLSRKWLHGMLFFSCIIVPLLLAGVRNNAAPHANLAFKAISPLRYALTQPLVLVHYLRMAVWPHPLIFDYLWPAEKDTAMILSGLLILSYLLVISAQALRRRPEVGFWAFWAFLILAPVSTIIPFPDLAAEHRMYLPLLGLLTLAVPALYRFLNRPLLFWGIIGAVAVTYGTLTFQRNELYRDPIRLWQQTTEHRPRNVRAWEKIAELLHDQGRVEEAAAAYYKALQVRPKYGPAYDNLGLLYQQQGDMEQARQLYVLAMKFTPKDASPHNHIGTVVFSQGNVPKSRTWFEKAIKRNKYFPEAHNNLGATYYVEGNKEEAIRHFKEALRLDPEYVPAQLNLRKAQSDAGPQTAR